MRGKCTAIAALVLLTATTVAHAQAPQAPVSQADVAFALGWLSAEKSDLDSYRNGHDWYHRSIYAGLGVGWYWTDHWKTEIDGGVSSSAQLDAYGPAVVDGRSATVHSSFEFATRRLAIGQSYQFYRNVWFHPFAGAGLDMTWEVMDRTDEVFTSQPVQPIVRHPRRTELLARPFTTFGFKAYINPRAFFHSDIKLVFDKGVDEALLRVGLGVDF